jgi:hypothetical protein
LEAKAVMRSYLKNKTKTKGLWHGSSGSNTGLIWVCVLEKVMIEEAINLRVKELRVKQAQSLLKGQQSSLHRRGLVTKKS